MLPPSPPSPITRSMPHNAGNSAAHVRSKRFGGDWWPWCRALGGVVTACVWKFSLATQFAPFGGGHKKLEAIFINRMRLVLRIKTIECGGERRR